MTPIDQKLSAIADQLKNGVVPPRETVRSILLWFGASKRGLRVASAIKTKFEEHKLTTQPDIESAYIDAEVTFLKATKKQSDDDSPIDPTHRVLRLSSANKPPVSVNLDSTLQQVITLMMSNDYSQLPVLSSPREVKGIVSWKSIGSKLALGLKCDTARDCLETAREVSAEDSLFAAIGAVMECDYVLVRGKDKIITGIITASDLTEQFQKLAEPFLLVGEIENGIRRILHGRFTESELSAIKAPEDKDRKIEGVSDLTFGEYIRLIEAEVNWLKLTLRVDRAEFTKQLHRIREIRNDVMHFDPDGLDPDDIKTLREFSKFLRRLREAGAA